MASRFVPSPEGPGRPPKPWPVLPDTTVEALEKWANQFLDWCCSEIGLGFHPDNKFKDYVNADGKRTFTLFESAKLERALAVVFSVFDDVYAECLKRPPFNGAAGG